LWYLDYKFNFEDIIFLQILIFQVWLKVYNSEDNRKF
jgi:hypothetical protein